MNKLVSTARRPRPPRRHLALATALAVAASLLVAGIQSAAQADPKPTQPATPPVTAFPRPNDPDTPLRAAIEQAKKQNKPVAVEAAYTESSRTWAYPDGHLTQQSYAGPSQLKQADGSWAWIDTTLVEQDGVLKPKVAKADVRFSLGGKTPFASLEHDKGQRFALSWLQDLPRPKVEGNVATYVDAAGPGADLVLTALPDGFRHDVVLRERPSKPAEIRIPVETDKLTFSKAKNGMLKLTDSTGATVAQAPAPVMTEAPDSPPAATGTEPSAQAQSPGKITTRVENGDKSKSTLVLTPDPDWLADPATQYPVVVDPTTTLTLQSDGYLYYYCGKSSNMSGSEIWAGSSLSSCQETQPVSHMRIYLDFDASALVGRAVASAQLELNAIRLNNSCSQIGALKVSRLTSGWGTGAEPIPPSDWANKPKVAEAGSQLQVCPPYNQTQRAVTWDIKNIANAWATGATNYGLQIRGENESQDTSVGNPGWVTFEGSYHTGDRPPKLTVSYMLPPEIPTVTAESIDSLDGTDAIARAQNVKVGFKSSVAEATNLNYTVTINESTMIPPPTAPTGHVAHWKFDEAAGAATAADASGKGNTATYSGSRRKSATGKVGSAIDLNDMTGSNGCCIPDSYAANSKAVLSQNSSFSVSTWAKLKNGDNFQYVASQDGDPFGLSIYYLGGSSQRWRLQISGTGGTTGYGVWVDTTQPVRTDAWSHLVAMYDSSASKIRLYVDGALSAEADYQAPGTVTSGPFRIGSRKGASGRDFLQGAVDDMRLYQRALTAKEVKDLYGEVSATSYNAKPSGQVIEQTFALHNPASLKFVVKACRTGVTPPSCNESPAYRITSDAPMLPTDTETGMADPTQPILSGMVNRPSGGPVSAKYYLYDNSGTPVGAAPLGVRTVNGGERASFQIPANTVQPGSTYTWQMKACVGEVSSAPDPDPGPDPTPTPTPDTDLKARWSFDEGTGATAADSSGNNHPITLTGATWGTGKSQSGLQLTGSTSSYGVTNGPAIHTNASYTVSAWARIDNITADHAIVSQDGAVNSAFKLAYSPGDKKWRLVTYQTDTTGATPLRALSTQNAVANQWTHLVGVYDATAGRIRLYVNGVLNAETAFTSSWDASSNVQIGRTKANGTITNYLKGTIDEVLLYQNVLTAEEVAALYANPAQVTNAALPMTTQEVVSGPEVCTVKTSPASFTTSGTPPPPPVEDVRHLTLDKDSFVIKTAKIDPTACDGTPCAVTDSTTMPIGGTGVDKMVSVVGFNFAELPDGAAVLEGILKLGSPSNPNNASPAETTIAATPLKSSVTSATKGSELAGDVDTKTKPYSLPLSSPQADIAGSEYQWLMLTSNKDELITFAASGAAEQPSLALTYLVPGPPSKVLNLNGQAGDASALASWGVPETNGSVAMLGGYDVEVTDSAGEVAKTVEVAEPFAMVTGLVNDEPYTMKVRAKTAFGAGEWEAVSVTPKAVTPPPSAGSEPCIPFLDTPPGAKTRAASSASGGREYIDRVLAYYRAQDVVLEGRADTIWEAPGVTPNAPSTAKLSLLNNALQQRHEALRVGNEPRSDSTIMVSDTVVQPGPRGTTRVTAKVTRSWEIPAAASRKGARAGTMGEVEPEASTISIHVFDRCGNMTEIQAPNPAYEDSTDFGDSCGLIEGSTSPLAATQNCKPPKSFKSAEGWSLQRLCYADECQSELYGWNTVTKGVEFEAGSALRWKYVDRVAYLISNGWNAYASVRITCSFGNSKIDKLIAKTLRLKVDTSLTFTSLGVSPSISWPPGASPIESGQGAVLSWDAPDGVTRLVPEPVKFTARCEVMFCLGFTKLKHTATGTLSILAHCKKKATEARHCTASPKTIYMVPSSSQWALTTWPFNY